MTSSVRSFLAGLALALLSAFMAEPARAQTVVASQTVDTGWVTCNLGDDVARSYPLNLAIPPNECAELRVRAQVSYRYAGACTTSPYAPEQAWCRGTGTVTYWLAHSPHSQGGMANPQGETPFFSTSAGGFFWAGSAPPGETRPFANSITFQPGLPRTVAAAPFAVETNSRRLPGMHRVWLTPQFREQPEIWGWTVPPSTPFTDAHVPINAVYTVECRFVLTAEWIVNDPS